MRDLLDMFGLALVGAAGVAIIGAILHRMLRGKSIVLHICLLLCVCVVGMLTGIVLVARAMFLSPHDLRVLLIVIGMSAVVSLAMGIWLGRRLAADAIWAEEARARERQMEVGRRELVAWVSHDLRTP